MQFVIHILIISLLVVANVYSFPLVVSLVVNFSLLILTGAVFARNYISINVRSIFSILIFLLVYTILISLVNAEPVLSAISKPCRALLSYFMFLLISRKISTYDKKEIIIGLICGLSINLIAF